MNPCMDCAAKNGSCCCNRQIVVTQGDVERIRAITGSTDFSTFEIPEPEYAVIQEEDPIWNVITLQPDGQRHVLKRMSNGDCFFLSSKGCWLDIEVRPLICRIHPCTYVENSLTGIDPDCPIARMPSPSQALEQICMPLVKVDTWRQQLYRELIFSKTRHHAR